MSRPIFISLLFLASVLFFLATLSPLEVGARNDEILYFESAKHMIQSGDFMTPHYLGEARFQKPILFYWLIALCYQLFGISWTSAKLVSIVFAALSVCFTWLLAEQLWNRSVAHLSAVIVATFPLFYLQARVVIPDMTLNGFIVAGMFFAWTHFQNPQHKSSRIFFFVACALGFLTKGWAAVAIPFLAVLCYAIFSGRQKELKEMNFAWGTVLVLAIVLPWFLWMIKLHGIAYLEHLSIHETQHRFLPDSSSNLLSALWKNWKKNVPFYGKTIFTKCLPWSLVTLLALPSVLTPSSKPEEKDRLSFLFSWIGVAFILLSSIHGKAGRYILNVTTPVSILTSYLYLNPLPAKSLYSRLVDFMKLLCPRLVLGLGLAALGLYTVFIANQSAWWFPGFILLAVGLDFAIRNRLDVSKSPAVLGFFMLLLLLIYPRLVQAGFSPQAAWPKFARSVEIDPVPPYVITIASKIYPNRVQPFFSQPVETFPWEGNKVERKAFFDRLSADPKVRYCIVLEADYPQVYQAVQDWPFEKIQEENLLRWKLSLNTRFFLSLLTFNKEVVRNYLFEKVFLFRRLEPLPSQGPQ